jgi:hypothetical protein
MELVSSGLSCLKQAKLKNEVPDKSLERDRARISVHTRISNYKLPIVSPIWCGCRFSLSRCCNLSPSDSTTACAQALAYPQRGIQVQSYQVYLDISHFHNVINYFRTKLLESFGNTKKIILRYLCSK